MDQKHRKHKKRKKVSVIANSDVVVDGKVNTLTLAVSDIIRRIGDLDGLEFGLFLLLLFSSLFMKSMYETICKICDNCTVTYTSNVFNFFCFSF